MMNIYKNKYLYVFAIWAYFLPLTANATLNNGLVDYPFAGNVNFLSIGATFRLNPDSPLLAQYTDACQVMTPAQQALTTVDLATAIRDPSLPVGPSNLGLPAGAVIEKAFLYWAGSYSADGTSTQIVPDNQVNFNGNPLTFSDIMFTSNFNLLPTFLVSVDFFQGFKDVTAEVTIQRDTAPYYLSDLSVNNSLGTGLRPGPYGEQHCAYQAVLAGWVLHVFYSDPVTEPFRAINLYHGLLNFRNTSLTLNPGGFEVPNPVPPGSTGKVHVTTWEGDNDPARPGETLTINGSNLTDAINPLSFQYNSTINTMNPVVTTSYGVDLDTFDLTPSLTPPVSATAYAMNYASGDDLVLLGVEIVSVPNVPVADLAITKTHVGSFGSGVDNDYTLTVTNNGPDDETGPIDVVDTLPVGMNFVAVSGTGWACSVAGSIISCSNPGPLVNGASLPPITLTVNVPSPTPTTLTNSATVSGALFDNVAGNSTVADLTNIAPPALTILKSSSAPSATPGSVITYTVQVNNTGLGVATSVTQDDNLSPYTAFGIDCMPATVAQPTPHTITLTEGAPASTLTLGTLSFSNDGGTTFAYVPPALGGGVCTFDPNITNFRQAMVGTMPPSGQYFLTYQTQVK